jgi:arabinofuranan 3-O-arabinosyltransferase
VAWLGVAALVGHATHHAVKAMPHGRGWTDSYVYLRAASDYIAHPGALYDAALGQINQLFAGPRYIYPPAGLLPFLPLVPVMRMNGVMTAASVWCVVDALAVIAAVVLIGRQLRLSWGIIGTFAVLVSMSGAFGLEVSSGQVNGVVLLLLALSWRSRSDMPRAVLLGLALALKPVALLLLVIPLLRGRWRVPLIAVGTIAALNLPFVALTGMHEVWAYVTQVFPRVAGFDTVDANNLSVAAVLDVWVGGRMLDAPHSYGAISPLHLPWAATGLLWAVRVAVIAALVRAARRPWADELLLGAAVTAAVPLFGAMSWPHYELYFLPLLLVGIARGSRPVRALAWAATFVSLWDGLLSVYYVLFPMGPRDWLLLAQGQGATVMATVAVLVVLVRAGRPRAPAAEVEREFRGRPLPEVAPRQRAAIDAAGRLP